MSPDYKVSLLSHDDQSSYVDFMWSPTSENLNEMGLEVPMYLYESRNGGVLFSVILEIDGKLNHHDLDSLFIQQGVALVGLV